jgi:hypothetical protein
MPAIDRIEHFIWTQHVVATVVTGAWRFKGSNDRLGIVHHVQIIQAQNS